VLDLSSLGITAQKNIPVHPHSPFQAQTLQTFPHTHTRTQNQRKMINKIFRPFTSAISYSMYARCIRPYNPEGGDKAFRISSGTKAGCTKTTIARMETSVIHRSPLEDTMRLGLCLPFLGGGGVSSSISAFFFGREVRLSTVACMRMWVENCARGVIGM